MMPRRGILFAALSIVAGFGAALGAALAQADVGARLSTDRLGDIQTGTFSAGDGAQLALDHYSDKYLMRFSGEPEIYVLYADHGSLGGRVLKYDSGETALQVAGWGAMTVYTDSQPGGLPTSRIGDSTPPVLTQLTLAQMQGAADDEGEHLSYVRGLHIAFGADWAALATDAALRALTFDAMQNAARGIDRFAVVAAARIALLGKLDTVRLEPGGRPLISLRGRTLVVTFVPSQGFAGRASSRGIARALGELLAVPPAG